MNIPNTVRRSKIKPLEVNGRTAASEVYLMDCVEGMKLYPDNYFELAVCDPEYGIGADRKNSTNKKQSSRSATHSRHYGEQRWDTAIPNKSYFDELLRVSKNQIVWGVNYFPDCRLVGGRIYWDKCVTMPTYSDGELAFCSLINSIRSVRIVWHGMLQGNMKNKEHRIHPTQKPVALYDWIFHNYAKPGDKILDSHLGSGSSRIAANKAGIDFTGFEIDVDYFEAQEKRFWAFISQIRMF